MRIRQKVKILVDKSVVDTLVTAFYKWSRGLLDHLFVLIILCPEFINSYRNSGSLRLSLAKTTKTVGFGRRRRRSHRLYERKAK